jgi:hypothetical protein
MAFAVLPRGWISVPCLITVVACAGAQRPEPEHEPEVVSSELQMRDVERTSKAPGTLSLVDPNADPNAGPAAPTAEQEAADASRESLRQLVIPQDLQVQRAAIDACYERALRDDPRLAGTLELAVRVARDGAVSKVKVRRDTVKHAGLRKCVSRAVSEVRTLQHAEGPEVTYPVRFGGSTSELL